uniref:Odorant binding protein 11 n=2 Tax=Anopheles funestus TaxID=62324 RepID=E5FD96_ANOFN|nr:odorant binding protein 11 [Anopheles funestus]
MFKSRVCILVVASVLVASVSAFQVNNLPLKTVSKVHPVQHHVPVHHPLHHEPAAVPVDVVKHTSSSFRPASFLELFEIVLDCFNTLRIPLQRFPSYMSGIFPDDAETKCFLRCVAIKLGVYCDEAGADLDRHCVQFGLGECCENFSNRHLVCLQQNSLPCPDRCTAAYKQELCFQEPITKYLDYHFHELVGLMHQAKCSHDLKMLHP